MLNLYRYLTPASYLAKMKCGDFKHPHQDVYHVLNLYIELQNSHDSFILMVQLLEPFQVEAD